MFFWELFYHFAGVLEGKVSPSSESSAGIHSDSYLLVFRNRLKRQWEAQFSLLLLFVSGKFFDISHLQAIFLSIEKKISNSNEIFTCFAIRNSYCSLIYKFLKNWETFFFKFCSKSKIREISRFFGLAKLSALESFCPYEVLLVKIKVAI